MCGELFRTQPLLLFELAFCSPLKATAAYGGWWRGETGAHCYKNKWEYKDRSHIEMDAETVLTFSDKGCVPGTAVQSSNIEISRRCRCKDANRQDTQNITPTGMKLQQAHMLELQACRDHRRHVTHNYAVATDSSSSNSGATTRERNRNIRGTKRRRTSTKQERGPRTHGNAVIDGSQICAD